MTQKINRQIKSKTHDSTIIHSHSRISLHLLRASQTGKILMRKLIQDIKDVGRVAIVFFIVIAIANLFYWLINQIIN